MTKRSKADPRQLCFVFEDSGEIPATGEHRPDAETGEASVAGEKALWEIGTAGEWYPEREQPRGETASPGGPAIAEEVAIRDGGVLGLESREPGTLGRMDRTVAAEARDDFASAYGGEVTLSGPDPALTKLCASWLEGLGMEELGARLTVVWNRRFTSAAGVARYGPNRIELNPALVKFAGEIERTLRHELAHLVARRRHPKKRIRPHGSEWRQACIDLGIPGEPIYHNLPFKSRRRKRNHAYRCAGCTEVVLRVRPLKGHCACYSCCKKYNRGRYDPRFKLEKVSLPAVPVG